MNKKWMKDLFVISALIAISPVNATLFGSNVTISDGNNSGHGWYSDREDQEVEPGMLINQKWDLEGTFIDNNTLTLVGGYDFENGYQGFSSGDVFLSNSMPVYGDIHRSDSHGNKSVANTYGYNYVLDLDFSNDSFDIVAIDETAQLLGAYYKQNEGSSPWQYVSGGSVIGSGSISLQSNLSNNDTGFKGGNHYAMSMDLSNLYASLSGITTLYSHYTMGCGNDNLMGSWEVDAATAVPAPASIGVFSIGLLGLLFSRRKQLKLS